MYVFVVVVIVCWFVCGVGVCFAGLLGVDGGLELINSVEWVRYELLVVLVLRTNGYFSWCRLVCRCCLYSII